MPLFFQHTIHGSAKIGVWHIEENESFFLKKISLQKEITHWHKRLQHLAGRYLLQELYSDFPNHLIEIADTRKPFLPGEEYHFSVSHCGDYAAVIISKEARVGVDIEIANPKIDKIKYKFLNEEELGMVNGQSVMDNGLKLLTLLWCCKEAVFKWYGLGGLDFKKDISLKNISFNDDEGMINCIFKKNETLLINIRYKIFEEICLAWII